MTSIIQPYAPKVAVVTGAAQGIGRAIALRLADDGLDVVLNDLPSHKATLDDLVLQIKSQNRRSVAFIGDVSKEADVQSLINYAVETMGGIDVMVANAGTAINSPLVATSVEEWQRVQNVNVLGVFLCFREAAKQMIRQGHGGRIIGAGSRAGKQIMHPNWSAYVASKFAVRGLTQAAGNEVDRSRVAHGLPEIKDRAVDNPPPDRVNFVGEVNDVAGLVSYLAKPESKFITGQSININGGEYMD
ncbi:hypothetical protein Clacol_009193 [Clathrus columnatus]|uniref:Uncharacterized protein n=1 Tax=Clathrus columnatus TaxID=1419009 RepID=A0AAV5AQF7_9AGAM|nr:hypothetical protein Clacol_009193 [Clathrus columnatus]